METLPFDQLNQNIRLYSLLVIIIGSIILFFLLTVLKSLVNKQVDKQIEAFAKKAKIPKILKDRIGVKIKLR